MTTVPTRVSKWVEVGQWCRTMTRKGRRAAVAACRWSGLLLFVAAHFASGAVEGTRGRYLPLTASVEKPVPFGSAEILMGPVEKVGRQTWQWWQLELRNPPSQGGGPVCVVRVLTSAAPLAPQRDGLEITRYLLRVPDTAETLEYRDRHTGKALLPGWKDFSANFLPRPAAASGEQEGMPETCELLGHVLTLQSVSKGQAWTSWEASRVLELDRELLVGTGRNFKDAEGHRLPQQPERRNYNYVPFEEKDYRIMFEAGINLFTVTPAQEPWVRTEPVFYLRAAGGQKPLEYPTDLYRANYLGPVMFMDEPSILMVGDKLIHNTLRYFSDAAALIEKRTRATYLSTGNYGAYALEQALLKQGANLGDMRLMQWDYPSWETLYDTTFYQMKGGGNGLVHEGRYQLPEFDRAVERFTGRPRRHTARELLEYHYAFLRGGTKPFGKFWGTAIYGQCDTNLAPEAVKLAYDMGARYVWFWTSDHDHHVPWPEQLELASALKRHAQVHPRPSLRGTPPKVDTAIVIPNGYFLSLENLWWVRVMDKEGKNEASQKYQRLMRRTLEAVHECFERKADFDITVDDGRPIKGYRRVVQVDDRD